MAQKFNSKLIQFATFSWLPTETINAYLYQIDSSAGNNQHEVPARMASFDYTSTLVVENMGQGLLMIALYGLLFTVYWLTCCLRSSKARTVLAKHMFWNGPIRLFMELYLETTLLSMLNVRSLSWTPKTGLSVSSNVLALVFLTAAVSLPVLICAFLCRRKRVWHHYWFKDKYGTLLRDTKLESSDDLRWAYLAIPMSFFARRFFLAACIVHFGSHLMTQLML